MTDRTPEQALTDVLGALVRQHETTDLLSDVVRDCAALLPAGAVAVLVHNTHRRLELLSATSHRASELELYQAQENRGPCVDAAHRGEPVSAVGEADLLTHWDDVGQAIVDSGFLAVHAFPMTWHGRPLGALNVFSESPDPLAPSALALAQTFASVATLALMRPGELTDDDLAARVESALEGRVVVEQAKGVLAHRHGLDMEAAYDLLMHEALEAGATLSQTARAVVRDAHRH